MGTRSCRTFTWFRFWSFTIWIGHFDGKICDFLAPDFDRTVHNQHGERKAVFNMCFNGEFYFGKARGSQVSIALWILHKARHDRKWPISLLLPFPEIYGAPRLLKICEIRENGKTRKITYIQNGFWSLERGKIMSVLISSIMLLKPVSHNCVLNSHFIIIYRDKSQNIERPYLKQKSFIIL